MAIGDKVRVYPGHPGAAIMYRGARCMVPDDGLEVVHSIVIVRECARGEITLDPPVAGGRAKPVKAKEA
jgi:hypothetical protein